MSGWHQAKEEEEEETEEEEEEEEAEGEEEEEGEEAEEDCWLFKRKNVSPACRGKKKIFPFFRGGGLFTKNLFSCQYFLTNVIRILHQKNS